LSLSDVPTGVIVLLPQPRSGDTTLATGVSPWFSNFDSALAP